MKFNKSAIAVVVVSLVHLSLSQTWCGKNYMQNQSVVPPGGQFILPAKSDSSLLSFHCTPRYRPYLEGDAKSASFLVDTHLVYDYVEGAQAISLDSSSNFSPSSSYGSLNVTISVGSIHTTAVVPLNTTSFVLPIDLSQLTSQKTAYNVTCAATYNPSSVELQRFETRASLLYLPDTNTSVTKTDLLTGALLARAANDTNSSFAPFVPQGFYINFDKYLANNLSMIDQLKADGFNTLHPIPPYGNLTIFQQAIEKSIEANMYIVYDMRSSYQNLTAVAQQVDTYASIPNLLHWETAHEPDGNSDPKHAAQDAYDLIYQMDGYHPVSIVLNCQDYNFSPYVKGADIVLQDAYPIGMNATWSPVWDTECTPDFGHCGCDNCDGAMYDVKARVGTYRARLDILGFGRTKSVWTTPQAFGSGAYWNSTPSGQQWAGMQFTSFTHGAMGSKSYQYPTTVGNASIESTAASLAPLITKNVQPFMVNPNATYVNYDYDGLDAGLWYNGTTYLLLIANLVSWSVYVEWQSIGLGMITNSTTQVERVFSVYENVSASNAAGLSFEPAGVGMYFVTV